MTLVGIVYSRVWSFWTSDSSNGYPPLPARIFFGLQEDR